MCEKYRTLSFREYVNGEWHVFDEETIPIIMPGQGVTLTVPFSPSSALSNVRMDVGATADEKEFENNSVEINRNDSGSGGCSIGTFPALVLALPLLKLLKR